MTEVNFKKIRKSCVYWIYLKDEHTDPFTQGYIGVSVFGFEKRFKNHLWHAARGSKLKVHRAIRKYGDRIAVKPLVIGHPEYCLDVEKSLRPVADMPGVWNLGAGGGSPGLGKVYPDEFKAKISSANKGRIPSEETRRKMSLAQTGRKHSAETKAKIASRKRPPHSLESRAKMSASWDKGTDWMHPRAKSTTWSLAKEMMQYIRENPQHGCERMMTALGLPKSTSPSIYKKLKSGWNPSEDPSYLSWLEEYNKQKEC